MNGAMARSTLPTGASKGYQHPRALRPTGREGNVPQPSVRTDPRLGQPSFRTGSKPPVISASSANAVLTQKGNSAATGQMKRPGFTLKRLANKRIWLLLSSR